MTSRLERITEQRLESLSKIRARGIDPYPHSYHPSHNVREAIALSEQQKEGSQDISLAGRIVSKRSIGKMSFLDIRDGSGKIQLSLRYDLLGQEKYEFLQDIDIGDIIGAKGKLFRTKARAPASTIRFRLQFPPAQPANKPNPFLTCARSTASTAASRFESPNSLWRIM